MDIIIIVVAGNRARRKAYGREVTQADLYLAGR